MILRIDASILIFLSVVLFVGQVSEVQRIVKLGQVASGFLFILCIHIYFFILSSTPKCFFFSLLFPPLHPALGTLRLLARLADIDKLGFQTGSADKEPINILCRTQFATVLAIDGTAVNDTGRVGNLGGSAAREPGADGSVDFLRLGDGGDFAGTNSPDGFVCKGVLAWV